ncbi:MAG TPA: hypothetical protein VFT16_05135 [Candidatus Saccharimonadales bacterium]|nr:hypothetical protein [Candidatus Saccharimonadales bacterium]
MEDLRDLIARRAPKEPQEIAAIKAYISDTLNSPSRVSLQGETIVITVASAALANTLRYHTAKLKTAAQTDRPVIIRIG